jgi:hypothetical protein
MIKRETVVEMRELLTDPKHWIKHSYAEDDEGNPLEEGCNEYAVCWCLMGAYEKVVGEKAPLSRFDFNEQFVYANGVNTLAFNDSEATTHQDVLDALDKLIKSL